MMSVYNPMPGINTALVLLVLALIPARIALIILSAVTWCVGICRICFGAWFVRSVTVRTSKPYSNISAGTLTAEKEIDFSGEVLYNINIVLK